MRKEKIYTLAYGDGIVLMTDDEEGRIGEIHRWEEIEFESRKDEDNEI